MDTAEDAGISPPDLSAQARTGKVTDLPAPVAENDHPLMRSLLGTRESRSRFIEQSADLASMASALHTASVAQGTAHSAGPSGIPSD